MADPYSPSLCRKIISAFFYQRPLITKKMEEKLARSKKVITLKIPQKGVVSLYDNSEDVRFRAARQGFTHYRDITQGPAAMVESNMPARACDGTTALLAATVDPTDLNACNGVRQWNFAFGHATRGYEDMRDAYKSPVICIEQYAQQGPDRVRAFFDLLKDEFSNHGPENFEANLRYLVIKYGESNASLTGSTNHFNVTTNGWEAPPTKLISIPWLERYRQYMMGVENGPIQNDLDILEVSMPRRDWFAAVADDITRTNGPNVQLEARFYTDERAPFFGKAFHEYKNIRCVFDEEPMKGYFVPTSSGTFNFVEVFPWRNVRGETIQGAMDGAGLVAERNPEYWQDKVVCNGVTYPMVTSALVLNSDAFERYGISESIAPAGVNQVGNNFNVEMRKDAEVPCNDLHNQFFLIAQHKFRFKILLPKLAGYILYLPEPQGIMYDRTPCTDTSEDTVDNTPASFNTLEYQGPDLCEQANCETCVPGTVANAVGACVADADGLFQLEPCGAVDVVVDGNPTNLILKVFRNGNLKDAAGVNYATANGTAASGVNYTSASGTLSWAADEGGYKVITVPVILADASLEKTFTVTLSSATGGASLGSCTVLTASIQPTG